MTTLKSIAVVLCLIGVTVNPVAAKFLPCCCTNERATKHACCHVEPKSSAQTAPAGRMCCTKKAAARPASSKRDCCCVKELPVSSPAPLTLIKSTTEKPTAEAAIWPAPPDSRFDDGQTYLEDHFSGRFRLSGPPLLALHCVWLK